MASFTAERMVRFGDCDPSGIAYFPAYLNLLNGCVEDFWTDLGHPWTDQIQRRRRGTPTAHLSCDFSRPSRFGDRLNFTLTIARIGGASLELHHRVACGAETRWVATQVLVSTDLETGAAQPWPADIRAALERFMETEDAHHPAA